MKKKRSTPRPSPRPAKPRTRKPPAAGWSRPRPAAPPAARRDAAAAPPELRDAARGVRLQKAMADLGVASRRDCEAMIEEGRVRVNGQPVTALPAWVDLGQDAIEVDGQRVNRPARSDRDPHAPRRHTYLMAYKPRNTISTSDDPEGRRTVLDLIATADLPKGTRLYPVGRLDADSTGLILLTDDGELANRLTHPRYEVTKDYEVSVKGKVSEEDADRLKRGLYLADRRTARGEGAKRATLERVRILGRQTDRERGDRTQLYITLREGQNREIRRLLARLGFRVRRLKRVAIGPLKLKGVTVGGWRPLTGQEIGALKKAAGLRA